MLGMSIYGATQGGKGKGGSSGITPYQFVQYPEYGFTQPRLQQTSDFLSQNIQRMSEGKYPAYYEEALPTLRKGMADPLRETYFGGQGMRGPSVMSQVRSTGAALGTGPKATLARENKALYDYGTKSQEIDQYLTKLGVDIMQRDAYTFPALSMQLPRGPEGQVVGGQPYNVPDYRGNAMNSIMQSLGGMEPGSLGNLDWLGNLFQQQTMAAPWENFTGGRPDYFDPAFHAPEFGPGSYGFNPTGGDWYGDRMNLLTSAQITGRDYPGIRDWR